MTLIQTIFFFQLKFKIYFSIEKKMWTNEQLHMLIDERKINNNYYHYLVEGERKMF